MVELHPLKAYRQTHGLNRKALADALSVTEVTIGRWENGKRGISKSMLPKIQEAFGIGADCILEFERRAA